MSECCPTLPLHFHPTTRKSTSPTARKGQQGCKRGGSEEAHACSCAAHPRGPPERESASEEDGQHDTKAPLRAKRTSTPQTRQGMRRKSTYNIRGSAEIGRCNRVPLECVHLCKGTRSLKHAEGEIKPRANAYLVPCCTLCLNSPEEANLQLKSTATKTITRTRLDDNHHKSDVNSCAHHRWPLRDQSPLIAHRNPCKTTRVLQHCTERRARQRAYRVRTRLSGLRSRWNTLREWQNLIAARE